MLSLRNKTYLILLVTTLLFFAATYGVVWYFTENELSSVQRSDAEDQLALVDRILEREMSNLSVKQADWARWDDTYQFVSDRNEAFITSNLNDESLKLIGVNIMAFINNSGELVYGKQVYDGAPGVQTIPDEFLSYFQGESDLLDFDNLSPVKNGILSAPDAMLIVTSQPITTSDGLGSRRGTLIFARYLDKSYTETLTVLSGLKVDIQPYGFTEVVDTESRPKILEPGSLTAIEYSDGKVIGLRLLDNIFGNPSILLRIEYPGAILKEGHEFLVKALTYSLFVLATYVSILIVVIDIFLLRRIENMRRIARQVGVMQAGGLPAGDIDDFSYLASIMMGAVKNAEKSKGIISGGQSELSKFKMALDQSFDHMIITDPDGKVLYANAAAETLTGYTEEEMAGKTPSLWGRQMSREFYQHFWDTIRLHKQIFEGEVVNKHKSGKTYRAHIRVAPILDQNMRILYFIGVERFLGEK